MSRKKKPTGPVTRGEALEILSTQLRNPSIAPNALIKITALYSKIANWKASSEPEDDDIDQLVRAAERRRKTQTQ